MANVTQVSVNSAFAVTNVSQEVLAANKDARYRFLQNDSDTDIYVQVEDPAALSQGILIQANGGHYEWSEGAKNLYVGPIYAIHGGAGNKTLLRMELE